MKILRIALRNLASLAGTHTVDFTRDPLRTAGLFSISGPTGSGKSTLLDALCLALYDDTPRLRGIGRLAELSNGERQNDPRNLLRRGAGEGFAEVAFAGVDREIYTARWMVWRAQKRADGALQSVGMTLFRGNVAEPASGEIVCGGKKTEVLSAIEARIGLSFGQLTRAVLLAQNDFATFLKADDHERAEILQALTGTERFASISIAVFERCAQEQSAVAQIENRLMGNAPLAPEARAEAETVLTAVEAEWKLVDEKLAARAGHATWFVRGGELARNIQEAEKQLDEATKARETAAPVRTELQLTEEAGREARPLWDAERRANADVIRAQESRDKAAQVETAVRTDQEAAARELEKAGATLDAAKAALESAQPTLRRARELDASLNPLAERLAQAVREREAADAQVKSAAQNRDDLQRRHAEAEKDRGLLVAPRSAVAQFALFAPETTAWLDRLDHAAEARRKWREAEAKLAEESKREREKETAASLERTKESAARQAVAAASAAMDKAEEEARVHDGGKIAAARGAAETARAALYELEKRLRREGLRAEMAELQTEDQADARKLTELTEQQIPLAKAALEAARRSFELAQAAVTDAAAGLREKLAPDQPCPVCGALDHPYAAHPPANEGAALRALRDDCTAKEKERDALREQAARIDAAAAARRKRISEVRRDAESLASVGTPLAEHPAVIDILARPSAERTVALQARLATETETLAALDRADEARRTAETHRDISRQARDAAARQLADVEAKLRVMDAELAGQRVAREAAGAHGERAERDFRTAYGELAPLFGRLTDAEAAWEHDSAAFRADFARQTAVWLELEKREKVLADLMRETAAALTPVLQTCATAIAAQEKRLGEEAQARAAHAALRAQRAAIFGGRDADAVEKELADALHRAGQIREACAEKLSGLAQRLAGAAETLRVADGTRAETIDRLATATAAVEVWCAAFGRRAGCTHDRPALEAMLSRDESWIRRQRAALEALDGAVRTAEGVLADRRKTLADHTGARPTEDDEPAVAADIAALHTARQQIEQRRDAARVQLHADDQRLRDNAALAQQLTERRITAEPWVKLNELIGSATGAKFRGIAQRRTLDLLLGYANLQLEQLAARYRLERLPESLNLIVLDRDMGDERRSVHSLSGGESFLVSLALALALASLTSNRLRIESLFIDEGFGSLDPETLNTAMNALMHLEAQGRKVGVISHVSEMADAIPVQIRVVKGRSGASRLIVPGASSPECTETALSEDSETTAISARILEILRREQAAGRFLISTRALRKEIGCELPAMDAARTILAGQIIAEGKSIRLAEDAMK